MRETVFRFVFVQPLNEHPMVLWGLLLVWLALVGNCIASIRAQDMSLAARWTWAALVVLLPVAGMALYLVRCLLLADYSFMKFVLGPPSKATRKLNG